jgi:hypothetical protein
MNLFDQHAQSVDPAVLLPARLARRRLGGAGVALGAKGSRLRRLRPTPPKQDEARSRCTPKAKHVIYLHMVGGPPQMDLYDYKPVMKEWYDKDLPDSIRMGQRLTTMTSGQARFPIAPSKFKFAAARRVRHVGQRTVARTRPRWSTTCASSAACTPRRSTTSRRSPTCRPATRSPAAPAWVRGRRTARLAEREPADLRRAGRQPDQHRAGAGDLGPAVVVRLSARRTRRRVLPQQRRSDPVHQQPARRPRDPPRDARRPQRAQRAELRRLGDPETHTRIQQYELAFRMQASVPD